MNRLLLIFALLLLTATLVTAQEAAPSPWFSAVTPCAIKSTDSLTSIGTGLSINVYKWSEGRSLWADGCVLYDAPQEVIGGFAGLSTEIKGLPIIEAILAPLQVLTSDALDTVGFGCKYSRGDATPCAYVTSHF